MIHFFGTKTDKVFAVQSQTELSTEAILKLNWLFGDADKLENHILEDCFVGPRGSMVSPWSTDAVEITQNIGISGIIRIEEFVKSDKSVADFDVMLYQSTIALTRNFSPQNRKPDPILEISDIAAYSDE